MSAPKTSTVTQSSEPWDEAKPYFEDLYKKAQDAFAKTNKKVYGGDLWASPNANQTGAAGSMAGNQFGQGASTLNKGAAGQASAAETVKGLAGQTSALGGKLTPGIDQINKLATDTISGKYMDPNTNPWLKATAEMAMGDVNRNFTQNVLPSMGSAAQRAGAYGGSRQGIMEGLAGGELARETGNIATNIYGTNYQQERDRQMQAPGLYNQAGSLASTIGGLNQAATGMYGAAGDMYGQAGNLYGAANDLQKDQWETQLKGGDLQQGYQQGQLNENYQRWQMEQQAPWQGIPELLSVLTGGQFQTSASTGPNPNYMNPIQTGSGIASGIAGLIDAFKS